MDRTMNHDAIPPEFLKAVPGTLGAIVALRWIDGSPLQKVAAVIGGGSGSYYGGEAVASALGLDGGWIGFALWLVGLFSMAIAHKCFEAINSTNFGSILNKLLARFGL